MQAAQAGSFGIQGSEPLVTETLSAALPGCPSVGWSGEPSREPAHVVTSRCDTIVPERFGRAGRCDEGE